MKPIESYESVLKNLVLKYNLGVWDEDLMQDAWITAINCYNHCKQNNYDDNITKAKIITWVKNKLIDIKIKKKHLDTVPLDNHLEEIPYEDATLLLIELRASLSENENEILTLLLEGYTSKEICEKTKKSKSEIYRIQKKIRGKIHE